MEFHAKIGRHSLFQADASNSSPWTIPSPAFRWEITQKIGRVRMDGEICDTHAADITRCDRGGPFVALKPANHHEPHGSSPLPGSSQKLSVHQVLLRAIHNPKVCHVQVPTQGRFFVRATPRDDRPLISALEWPARGCPGPSDLTSNQGSTLNFLIGRRKVR